MVRFIQEKLANNSKINRMYIKSKLYAFAKKIRNEELYINLFF